MGGKSGTASKVAAAVVIGFNLIVMILCAGVFAISLWIITSPRSISKIIQTVGSPVVKVLLPPEFLDVQLGVALAVLAIFVFFIAFMGFYGAITRSQFLLFMYAILVILLMLLEGSLFFYYTSDIAEKGVRDDGQLTHALRVSFQCCEFNYSLNAVEKHFPWSCCGVKGYPNNCTFDSVFIQDCQHTISSWLSRYQFAIYVPLVALHVILVSCSLLRRRRSASHSHS